MTRPVTVLAALASTLLVTAVAHAATRPPDNPVGATVALTTPSVPAGGDATFTGTGFTRTGGGGQIVTVKLDDVTIIGTFTADASGAVTGTVPVATTAGDHWLRFLAGSGGPNGASGGEPPARSLTADLTVTPPPAGTTVTIPSAPAKAPVSVGAVLLDGAGKKARVELRCPATNTSCSGAVALRAKGGWSVGRTTYALAADQSSREPITLSARARKTLARTGRLPVTIKVTTVGAASATRSGVLGG